MFLHAAPSHGKESFTACSSLIREHACGCAQAQHPALEVVNARLREGSAPGQRRDKHKVGLVVEGGGMRGVVTGAALQAMHDLGMRCATAPPSVRVPWGNSRLHSPGPCSHRAGFGETCCGLTRRMHASPRRAFQRARHEMGITHQSAEGSWRPLCTAQREGARLTGGACSGRDAFDAVYGSSAGAINATYFLSGQRDGVSIYTSEIANERFIDLRRLFRRGPGAPRPQHTPPAQPPNALICVAQAANPLAG